MKNSHGKCPDAYRFPTLVLLDSKLSKLVWMKVMSLEKDREKSEALQINSPRGKRGISVYLLPQGSCCRVVIWEPHYTGAKVVPP